MRRVSLIPLLALGLGACAQDLGVRVQPEPVTPPPDGVQVREQVDPRSGVVLRSWGVRYEPDGRAVREGKETLRWPEGGLRAERDWSAGESHGLWRTWYPSGELESEHEHCGERRPMVFLHANGQVRAMGEAVDGVKQGLWYHYRPSGVLEKVGHYERGEKHGVWTTYHASGSLAERGWMAAGHRVGEWRRWPLRPQVWSDPFWPEAPPAEEDATSSQVDSPEGNEPR